MVYKILVVDDSQFMRNLIKTYLNKAGYSNIIYAQNGIDAIHKYIENNPDLVLMDITMDKMNGVDALINIKKIDSSAKVVMCQAMGQEDFVMRALRNGALDFIVKPFNCDRMVRSVHKILPI